MIIMLFSRLLTGRRLVREQHEGNHGAASGTSWEPDGIGVLESAPLSFTIV